MNDQDSNHLKEQIALARKKLQAVWDGNDMTDPMSLAPGMNLIN